MKQELADARRKEKCNAGYGALQMVVTGTVYGDGQPFGSKIFYARHYIQKN